MIKVTICRNREMICRITVRGHADSAEYGKDLVCAAVSSAITGVFNELIKRHAFDESGACYRLKEGFAELTILTDRKDVQVVLETLVTIFETIENSYSQYLKITQREV